MRNLSATAKALTRATLAGTAVALTLTVGTVAAQAAPTAVTFNPGAFSSGASQFTADVLNLKDFTRVDLGATSGSSTSFTENGFLQVNNVSLNNSTPAAPGGLNSTYSLYFQYTATGMQNASSFTTSSTGTLNSLNYTLYGVQGVSTFGFSGTGDARVASVTDNGARTVLATGSLINGTTSFSAINGSVLGAGANVNATYIQTLANFILSPANATLNIGGAFNNNPFIVEVINGGQSFLLNGGGGDLSFAATTTPVPEPASMMIFGTALAGLGAFTRRRRKTA